MPREAVAVDASGSHRGDSYFLVGTALHFTDLDRFRQHYMEVATSFCDRFNIATPFPVLKSRDLGDQIPSYDIRDAHDRIINELLASDAIRNVYVTVTFVDEDVSYLAKEMSGIQFTASVLSQYYPIIPLWRFHYRNRDYIRSREASLDGVQGKITKAWSYVGHEFDLRIIPHGDQTYPEISTCDLISNFLSKVLPRNEPFREYAGISIASLKDRTSAFVDAEIVDKAFKVDFVPAFPYELRQEQHFLHPVFFLYDELYEDTDAVMNSDFGAAVRKAAFSNEGSVCNLSLRRHGAALRSGDQVIHTEGSDPRRVMELKHLHFTKDVDVLSSKDFLEKEGYL